MLIAHVTLLTGHVMTHRLDTLEPWAVDACRALLPGGGQIPGFPAYRVQVVRGAAFTIWRGGDPIVTCGVGTGEDDTWRVLVELQARVGTVKAAAAPAGRWLAVAILPGIALIARTDVDWLGDFERCMAAALLASS